MSAWTVAIATFAGEVPAVVHNGCGEVRDMKWGLKADKEDNAAASVLSVDSQWAITRFLTIVL